MLSQAGQLNRYVEMTSGSGRVLGDGAVLGLDVTDQPVELDDALSMLTPELRTDVRRISASLDRGLRGHGGDLSASLKHADGALRETNALVANIDIVPTLLAATQAAAPTADELSAQAARARALGAAA